MHGRASNLCTVAVALTDRQRGVDWMPGIGAWDRRPVVGGATEVIGFRGTWSRSLSICKPAAKEEAIREMVGSLHQAGKLANDDLESVILGGHPRSVVSWLQGIGQGVAVPHTRHPTLHRLIGTVALSRRGVDFVALDGEPVTSFSYWSRPRINLGIICGPWRIFRAT